jgi:hypothetical protein
MFSEGDSRTGCGVTFSPKVTLARVKRYYCSKNSDNFGWSVPRSLVRATQDQPNPSEPFPYLVVRKTRGDWVKRRKIFRESISRVANSRVVNDFRWGGHVYLGAYNLITTLDGS